MSEIRNRYLRDPLGVLMALTLTAALVFVVNRYSRLSKRAAEDSIASMRKDEKILQLEGDLRESNRLLRAIPITDVRIEGDTVSSSTHVPRVSANGQQLVVVISRLCRVCSASLPLLDSIERRRPGTVVGVTFGDNRETIEVYSRSHRIQFPIIVAPRGELVARLPRHATPVFLLRDSIYVKGIDIGLTEVSRERLSQLAR